MAGQTDGLLEIDYWLLDSADLLASPLLRRLHEEWQAAAPAGGLPGHDFIDPLKLDYLLGDLLVIGVERAETGILQFHYRLVGTEIVARRTRDFTGRWMHENDDPLVATVGPVACRAAVEACRPVHLRGRRRIEGRLYPMEYLMLPLAAADGVTVDRLLIAQLYPADAPRLPYGEAR